MANSFLANVKRLKFAHTQKKLNFPFCTLAGKFHTIVHKNGFVFSTKNFLEMKNVLLLLFPRRGSSQQGQA